ncbi:ATP-dependent DNA ligase [Streptomyces sp. NPDC058411]|uniref:ATP-dependent DNA ligase n=1 Tax=Streptomyces sp. NPDC058411 TaxID=3346485 RepID=UPI003661DE7F
MQRRATAGRNARALAAEMPAHFIVFDVLQSDGQELLEEPFARRREVPEALFASYQLDPPWTLCPSTTDPAVAGEWLYEWTDVPGGEGVVLKSLASHYQLCVRGWTKVRCRNSTEALIGGVTGSLHAPRSCCWAATTPPAAYGWCGQDRPAQARLAPGPRRAPHRNRPGPPLDRCPVHRVLEQPYPLEPALGAPVLVAEISAHTAQDHGVWRHPLRYERLRLNATEADVPPFGETQ